MTWVPQCEDVPPSNSFHFGIPLTSLVAFRFINEPVLARNGKRAELKKLPSMLEQPWKLMNDDRWCWVMVSDDESSRMIINIWTHSPFASLRARCRSALTGELPSTLASFQEFPLLDLLDLLNLLDWLALLDLLDSLDILDLLDLLGLRDLLDLLDLLDWLALPDLRTRLTGFTRLVRLPIATTTPTNPMLCYAMLCYVQLLGGHFMR